MGAEVSSVPPAEEQDSTIALQNATVTWPQERARSASNTSSIASTPKTKFILMDLCITFPQGELSLICGKLGSGKTLLLLCEDPPIICSFGVAEVVLEKRFLERRIS